MGRGERWKRFEVVKRQVGKGVKVVKSEGGRFLVLFKRAGCKLSPRFHLFVSDVNQGSEEAARFSCVTPEMEGLSIDLPRAVKVIECAFEVGCAGMWNL